MVTSAASRSARWSASRARVPTCTPACTAAPTATAVRLVLFEDGDGSKAFITNSGTPITSIVTATGTVNPVVSVLVGSQVSGKIAKLFVDFNAVVQQGQPLAQIDPLPFQSRVNQARAAVKSAAGNLAKATNMAAQRKRERDRMAALRKQAFVSQADLDLANTNYRDADANVQVMNVWERIEQGSPDFITACVNGKELAQARTPHPFDTHPVLSARITNATYLSEMMTRSDQNASEHTP